ncbi:hypothetical protein BJ912DRAFT_1050022 [Pholiota molesta]|nr:hypothetical protein BJ912DRAFT_1050022 [Pholiota molesta]
MAVDGCWTWTRYDIARSLSPAPLLFTTTDATLSLLTTGFQLIFVLQSFNVQKVHVHVTTGAWVNVNRPSAASLWRVGGIAYAHARELAQLSAERLGEDAMDEGAVRTAMGRVYLEEGLILRPASARRRKGCYEPLWMGRVGQHRHVLPRTLASDLIRRVRALAPDVILQPTYALANIANGTAVQQDSVFGAARRTSSACAASLADVDRVCRVDIGRVGPAPSSRDAGRGYCVHARLSGWRRQTPSLLA